MVIPEGYKQTEVGIIPEDWEIKKLSALSGGGMQNGVFYESSRKGTGIGIVNVKNLYENAPIRKKSLEKFDATNTEIERFRVNDGDLFFTRSSIVPSGIAHTNWYEDDTDNPAVFDSHVIRFRTDKNQVVPMYLYLQCISNSSRSYFIANAKTATMTTIDQKVLGECPIVVASFHEQENISKFISDMNALISQTEKLLGKQKVIKQGAMQALLTGKQRLPGFIDKWEFTQIGDITDVFSGGTPNTAIPQYWGGSIPWMSSGELNKKHVYNVNGRITELGLEVSSTHFIPQKCVLIGLAGQGKTRGTAAINHFPLCTNQSIAAIYPNPENFDSLFLYYVMDTQYSQLRELSSGDGGRGGLTKQLIKDYTVFMPSSIEEQRRIAEVLFDIDNEITELKQKLDKYRRIKQGMMQQLLTGKIRLV